MVITAPTEMLAWHWVGGLLLGAYACPASVPTTVEDERLRRVLEALVAVRHVDGAWPVAVERVADVLHHVGALDEIGGVPFLLELIESWSERVTRGRELGEREAQAQIALARLHAEIAAEDELIAAIERREQARTMADEAMRPLASAAEVAA